jgi:hypothetical protein
MGRHVLRLSGHSLISFISSSEVSVLIAADFLQVLASDTTNLFLSIAESFYEQRI